MDAWAARYFGKALFVCVGCDGPQLASTFVSRLQLKSCSVVVGNPFWGQLGCNGFIVLDGAGRVACKQSAAFMEVRELAFKHVEALLEALIAERPVPPVCPGQHVELRGLSKPELNGERGFCVEGINAETGRCGVALYAGRQLSVKPSCLRVIGAEEEELEEEHDEAMAVAQGGGCDTGA